MAVRKTIFTCAELLHVTASTGSAAVGYLYRLVAAILGAVGGKVAPQKFATDGGHGSAKQSYGLALIRYKVGVITVIATCGGTGLLISFIKIWLAQQGFAL